MALSRDWRSLADIPFPSIATQSDVFRSFIFLLKNLLLGASVGGTAGAAGAQPAGKWALVGSSNGVTFGLDATERLGGSVYDASKWVWAYSNSATTPHTWFVLQNAALGVYLVIDCKGPGTTEVTVSYGLCTAMPTGGSLTTVPTLAGVSVCPLTSVNFFEAAGASLHRANWCMDAASGFFFLAIVKSGTGAPYVREGLMLWPTTGPTQRPPWVFAPLAPVLSGAGVFLFNSGAGAGLGAPNILKARSYDGASSVVGMGVLYTAGILTNMSPLNPLTGAYDLLPALVQFTTAGQTGVAGLEDIDICGDSLTGMLTPTAGAPERAVFGHLLAPFSSAYSL